MAISIDGAHLEKHWIPDHENHLDAPLGTARGRFAINKVYLHATVVHDPAKMQRLARARSDGITHARQKALDWQQDPGDALHDCEVFKHLHEIGETSFPYIYKDSTGTKSATMSVDATSHRAGTRYSIKISMVRNDRNEAHGMYLITHTNLQKLFPSAGRGSWCKWGYEPKISSSRGCAVVWQMQIDFVDLQQPAQQAIPSSRWRKRRRTINEFQTVPPPKSQIRGVRWREERRMWMAETRIPGFKQNKVWFGEFKTEEQAARAVDAAFYYYKKPLNFANSARILADIPVPTAASKEGMQKFVKEVAKWLAHCNGPFVPAQADHVGVSEAHLQASTSAADQGHDECGDEYPLEEFFMVLDDVGSCGGWSTSTSLPPLEYNNAEYDALMSLIMDSPAAPPFDHAMSPSHDYQSELTGCLMHHD